MEVCNLCRGTNDSTRPTVLRGICADCEASIAPALDYRTSQPGDHDPAECREARFVHDRMGFFSRRGRVWATYQSNSVTGGSVGMLEVTSRFLYRR